ncbi:hypothetical protein A9993_08415 [Rahnella victoriana]|uniref:hypothetical protein n=1 Tax=Rahnella victoriana TaxID=1510570 RepID=UPI000BB18577|nr:hypothetical protein [Rahnella victoriana]PBI79761.1 hypothetical protein A9993_08415 [Rahnella victoriana]
MVNLAITKGNSTTGVHMLQRDKNGGFRIRTSPDSLKRFTSVEVRPEHRGYFKGKNEIYGSKPYNTIEDGAAALCAFIERVCSVACVWEPEKKEQLPT